MPILKQLVSSAQTKRRSRLDLTREMISAPLGDFRHTMHVGRSGDAFGDTSFLSTRSGEPESASFPRSPRPGLLARTFRSSKRSQSVNRVDEDADDGSVSVKSAMSLPFLHDDQRARSLTSSPYRQEHPDFLELEEQRFGDLSDLPESSSNSDGGMKHAESVMSFHLDLGPSMLNDILGVMEKDEDDQGYEEGKNSEGRGSPPVVQETRKVDGDASARPVGAVETGAYKRLQHLDSSSVSSSGSAAVDERASGQNYAGDTDSATFSVPPEEENNFSSFLEDEDDEIRL